MAEKEKKKDDDSQKGILSVDFIIFVAVASVGIYWFKRLGFNLADLFGGTTSTSSRPPENNAETEEHIQNFLEWFQQMGGWMSRHVTLKSFPGYGYGLLAILHSRQNKEDIIMKGDKLLIVPESIQFSSKSTLARFRQLLDDDLVDNLVDAIQRYYDSQLEVQDVIIALGLMMECSLGDASFAYPYISMLPKRVPRLDTFQPSELKLLQDPQLEALAKQSKSQLQHSWDDDNMGIQQAVQKLAFAAALADAKKKAENDNSASPIHDETCLSFASFHRFVAIVSSHAMILDNTKYLVPMADMINHAPQRDSGDRDESSSFTSYHLKSTTDGSITVLADRFFDANFQIFEEYGKLDNSIFLMAFGFVPNSNPYHCAIFPAQHLPRVQLSDLQGALTELNLLDPAKNRLMDNSVCVKRDGTFEDDESSSLAAYLAVSNLEVDFKQRQKCVDAVQREDRDLNTIRAECIQYPNHDLVVKNIIQKTAETILSDSETSLQEDLSLLKEYEKRANFISTPAWLALRFRIADKWILYAVSRGH